MGVADHINWVDATCWNGTAFDGGWNTRLASHQDVVEPATGQPLIEPECGSMIVREASRIADREGSPIALIVQPPARRALAALLKSRAPRCLVLSIAELPAAQPIAVVGVIGAPDEAPELAPPAPEGLAA